MRNKKYYIAIVLLLITLTFSSTAFASVKPTKHRTKKIVAKHIVTPAIKENSVTLSVLDNTYTTKIKNGATVYEAMNSLRNTKNSNFSFHSKDYSSLGSFIDEINGVKGIPGKYWIYYVNGKKASLGVSKYVLTSGDSITWKQEGF